ncbi:MAG TPA: hypothetical protein GXX75_00615 [Clostridiales bacterium]|nr:hypothetical protein [Clostridiales bacterium]
MGKRRRDETREICGGQKVERNKADKRKEDRIHAGTFMAICAVQGPCPS